MKKIVLFVFVLIFTCFYSSNIYAEDTGTIKVEVPINFSWVFGSNEEGGVKCSDTAWDNGKYYCNVPKWTSWFQVVLAWIIKYLIFIASLAWVLFIVINGILYTMSGINDSLKSSAKERIIKTLLWIILLIMSWVILNIIAPWVYK